MISPGQLQLGVWEQTPFLAATHSGITLFFSGGLWSQLIISRCSWLMELLSMTPARSLKANLANLPLAVYVLGLKCAPSESDCRVRWCLKVLILRLDIRTDFGIIVLSKQISCTRPHHEICG